MTSEQQQSPRLSDLPVGTPDIIQNIDRALFEFHDDLAVLLWGCNRLWHDQFKADQHNEFLSRFPIVLLQMLAARTDELRDRTEKLVREAVR